MRYVSGAATGRGQSAQSAPKSKSQQKRREAARDAITRAVLPALGLEHLERRTLLSTLPLPNVTTHTDVSGGGTNINQSNPSIAYNPKNPQKLVTVFTSDQPGVGGTQKVFVGGRYSINGGATWQAFDVPGNLVNPSASGQQSSVPYEQATDATVGFDLNDNFYIAYSEHSSDHDHGAIVLQKYSLAGNAPQLSQTTRNVRLYQWHSNDAALTPFLKVDTNQASFTDPGTGDKQEDAYSNNIYVAWSTDNRAPTGANNSFNPNTIKMVVSDDGGQSFSTPITVNPGGNFGADRDGYPRLAVSQGTADGRVLPGQVTVIWDDFNSGRGGSNPVDFIKSRGFTGGNNHLGVGSPGPINDAVDADPDVATDTDFVIPIDITDPNFTLSDLDVELELRHDNLAELRIVLVAPDGTQVTLLRNRQNVTGGTNENQGVNGSHFGLINETYDVPFAFDSQAARILTDPNAGAPFAGHFRPEAGDLSIFNGMTAAQLKGNWTVRITDNNRGGVGNVNKVLLRLTSGMTENAPQQVVASTPVLGVEAPGAFPLQPAVAPDRGIGPGADIASDNTLGSFSPYQGRLYVTYVGRQNGGGNPTDNTDIFLVTSDDGGQSWSQPVRVNDDNGLTDGFSEAVGTTGFATSRGRPQFLPAVTVDQTTGTLVMTWFDARHDPARAKVATYMATSIDGGATFGPQTFLNAPNVITDAITGKPVVKGPIPDNFSEGNQNMEETFAFGNAMGLAAVGGRVFPVWSGNENGGPLGNQRLRIFSAGVTIAAGPRIVSSTMGPVSQGTDALNPPAADGSPRFTKFQVVFDRPIDPATFTASMVKVFFRNPTTVGTSPGTEVNVTSVVATDTGVFGPAAAEGATTFIVNVAPQTAVGTYSYFITPDARDRIRSVGAAIIPGTTATHAATGNQINLRIPATGLGGSNTAADVVTSTINVAAIPAGEVVSSVKVNVSLTHAFDDDLVLTLIAPDGRRILLSSNNGGADNDYTNTVFDDLAATSITQGSAPFTGSFRPEESLGQLAGLDPNGPWRLEIRDSAPGDFGNLVSWSVTITRGVAGPGAGNKVDQNSNAVAGEAAVVGTGDVYAIPNPTGIAPFNGTFFLPPFGTDTAPISIPGPHLVSSKIPNNPASADNLALNKTVSAIDVTFDRPMDPSTINAAAVVRLIGPVGLVTGPFTVTANPLGNDPNPNSPRTYRIGFPAQTLSGTYTVTLASSIKSAAGDSLDTNLNAGIDALRGISSVTVPVTSNSADVPQPIGSKVARSTITITDPFLIQSATLALNITYPNDPDLTATLIAPDGTQIILFSNVGLAGASKANFSNTVFDDAASTPIQNGAAPFFGKFNPQLPLSALVGKLSSGKWTLEIRSSAAQVGTLNSWSLTFAKPVPGTGAGQVAADQAHASFRIFTMDPANPQSHNTWTAVGGASNNGNANAGRIGGIALDPSDPSGNTVYTAGSSGGIWKTRNFLTNDPQGPTWVPLTDFGPANSLNIGSLAVFSANNDPNQSIVFAGTGFGDLIQETDDDPNTPDRPEVTTRGVGFLRSMDGGASWQLLDSTKNVDAQGNLLPINSPQRDHIFVGSSSFKVLVDPKPTPSGDVVVYAAVSGAANVAGVWRSLDSGKNWQRMRAGQATDIVFDMNSGFFDALNNPTGNLQYLYAAFENDGVFFSPNRGTVWNKLLGGVGDPLIRDQTNAPTAVGVDDPEDDPNGNKGRITLAKPALTGNTLNDVQYQGWLYALVSAEDESFNGLYMTKDFGQNWVKVRIPITAPGNGNLPSNDTDLPDDPILAAQGDYNQSLAVDPTNPAVVYVGGARVGRTPSDVLRVDTTFVHDAHAFFTNDNNGGNGLRPEAGSPVQLKQWPNGARSTLYPNAVDNPYVNLVRDPKNPFLASASVNVLYADSFTNDGGGATWLPFSKSLADLGGNQHRMLALIDPATGKSRLIVGTDLGIFSVVDDGKGMILRDFGAVDVPTGTRNGNIQITAFNYGAVQPSSLAAQVAGALFYGQANDNNGSPQSTPDVLNTGNIGWVGPIGRGEGVATDQTGSGTVYRFNMPGANNFFNGNQPAGTTDFFLVTAPGSAPGFGTGRTFQLLQASNPGSTPDPQWPSLVGSNFAVNPINKDQIFVSSQAGRIFATGNQGVIWAEIGNPTALDGTYAPALAYGAPDPQGPGGADAINFFLYAGTTGGKIFVTFNGGGASGNDWIDISAGLDGSTVKTIITNPARGSHEAYAVTEQGVYYMADSNAANPTWTAITGNLKAITHNPFGDPTLSEAKAKSLTALVADWRYAIPDNLNNPNGPAHPVLYVAGDAGVYRSFDKGATWSAFPNEDADGAPANGGYLPNVRVTDLDLGIGTIDPTTGQPLVAGSPDVLLATTYGRGSYAIRVAPTVAPGTLKLVGTVGGSQPLVFSGISQMTAFGNKVRVSIFNLTNPNNPQLVGGWNGNDNGTGTDNPANRTDAKGNFSLQVPSSAFGPGTRIIGVRLTDDAGVVSTALLTFPPAVPSVPNLVNASDTGISNTDNLTNDNTPTFSGTADPGVKVTILRNGVAVGSDLADSNGNWTVTSTALGAGEHSITATATDIASNVASPPSAALIINIDVAGPPAPSAPNMIDASDSGGSNTDNITNVQTPTFTGTAEKGATVTLFDGANPIGTTVADINTGEWSILSSSLGNGGHTITARATDTAGNQGPASPGLAITVDVILPNTPSIPDLLASSDDGPSDTDNNTSDNTPTFTGTADPGIAIELLADGTVVGTGTAGGNGVWTITSSVLGGGVRSITARARDVAGNTSLPSVGLTVTLNAPFPTPSTPNLTDASDTGSSNSDNLTNVKTPTFTGTGPAGATIELLANGAVVGTATAGGNGAWSVTVASALADGAYNFVARAKSGNQTSPDSSALAVTIDSAAPATPGAPDLTAASDTGSSSTDNNTTDNTPTFTGTAAPNTVVELLANNTVFGTTTSNAQGQWTATSTALPNGTFVFSARTRDAAGNLSPNSSGLSVTITNAPPPQGNLTISSFTLVNAATGQDIMTLTEGIVLDLNALPAQLAIRANPNPSSVGSIRFGYDQVSGQFVSNFKTESLLPYALFADSANGTKYNAGIFNVGTHKLTATPYGGKNASGTVGTMATLNFTIKKGDTPPQGNNTVTSFSLINADTDQVIRTINNNDVLNLASLPKNLAIRANTNPATVGSVRFGYDQVPGQFKTSYKIESGAPYAMFGDVVKAGGGIDYKPGLVLTKGAHTLTGTVFSGKGATGTVGGALTVKFTVT